MSDNSPILTESLQAQAARLDEVGRLLGVEQAVRRVEVIDGQAQDPGFWKNCQTAAQLMKERAALAALITRWQTLHCEHQSLTELAAEFGDQGTLREEVKKFDRALEQLRALAAGDAPLEGVRERPVNAREPTQTFLIVCEGQKTEPAYFEAFRLPSAQVRIVGTGSNTKSLVELAIRLKEREDEERDQYWCVFDHDSFPPEQFNSALQRARANGFQVAYSNVCFEIWYLLHFDYHDSALDRSLYWPKLSAYLGWAYEKNSRLIYETLLPRQETALRNAQRLLGQYSPHHPEKDNPCTTVHLLVEELNQQIRRRPHR